MSINKLLIKNMIFEGKNALTAKIVNGIAEFTPRCHDITRLLSESLDKKLPWSTRAKLQLHYSICVWCERYGQQLRLLRQVSRELPERTSQYLCERMPLERKDRVRETLRGAR